MRLLLEAARLDPWPPGGIAPLLDSAEPTVVGNPFPWDSRDPPCTCLTGTTTGPEPKLKRAGNELGPERRLGATVVIEEPRAEPLLPAGKLLSRTEETPRAWRLLKSSGWSSAEDACGEISILIQTD